MRSDKKLKRKYQILLAFTILIGILHTAGAEVPTDVVVDKMESLVIAKSDQSLFWYPTLRQIDADTLLVTIQTTADEVNPDAHAGLFCVSKDKGRTWSAPQPLKETGISWTRLKNGTFLNLGFWVKYQNETTAKCRVGRSPDGLHYQWSDGIVDVTPWQFDKHPTGAAQMVFHRSILEMPDDILLASMYGRFVGDKLDRTILVVSRDGGTNWKFYATVACDPNVGGEGLNEPDVIRLANGDLFCFLRNASEKPMYSTRSSDGGKTWSPIQRMPENYAALSVDPDFLLLDNGVLACSAGRPDCHLIFSLDGSGKSWTPPFTVFTGPTLHYTTICQISPNQIFYLHDVVPSGWNVLPKKGQFNEIRGVFITLNFK